MTMHEPLRSVPPAASDLSVFDASGDLLVMPSVYSLAFAETNECFASTRLAAQLWNVSASRADFDAELAGFGLGPPPLEGERKLGLMDLVHVPIVDGIVSALAGTLPGIDRPDLQFRYPLHGSSAGIGLLLNHLRTRLGVSRIFTLAGDYEGYAAQAANFGLDCRAVSLEDAATVSSETFFVSNPSARDGEPLGEDFVAELTARNRVVFDVAYHGLHGPSPTRVPAGAWAVLWSLSKPWGLFWRRVGLLVSQEEIPGAYSTRWFKDPERLLAAYATVRRFVPSAMSSRYRFAQRAAIDALAHAGFPARPASTVLLATFRRTDLSAERWSRVAHCERVVGSGAARACLTPLMERIVAASR